MSAACAPSRASLLTGQYPSLHGVTQTDGLSKSPDSDDMFWLAPDTVPTLGDWLRAGGYRTFYKGKWHASHAHLDADDGSDALRSIDDGGTPQPQNIDRYLEADLLDDFGFSEWVGPEPHGIEKHNLAALKDPFTADETIDLLQRLDAGDGDEPWLTVCSFLNPHDVAYFGLIGLKQGLRYHPSQVPHVGQSPTRHEDLSTKPRCQQSMVDLWSRMAAPQPFIEAHLKYYYEVQAAVDVQIARVLDALQAGGAYENTIVIFSSDHGDMMGAHGGAHQKWHNAYEESLRIPFVVSSPLLARRCAGAERPDEPRGSHPDDPRPHGRRPGRSTRAAAGGSHGRPSTRRPRPLGRDPRSRAAAAAEPVLFMTDDEISEGAEKGMSPIAGVARRLKVFSTIEQPNHVETVIAEVPVDGEPHLVKFSRYHDNQQFWTVPARARRAPARPQDAHGDRAGGRRVRALRPHARPDRGAQPRASAQRGRPVTRAAAAHAAACCTSSSTPSASRPQPAPFPGYRPPPAYSGA